MAALSFLDKSRSVAGPGSTDACPSRCTRHSSFHRQAYAFTCVVKPLSQAIGNHQTGVGRLSYTNRLDLTSRSRSWESPRRLRTMARGRRPAQSDVRFGLLLWWRIFRLGAWAYTFINCG